MEDFYYAGGLRACSLNWAICIDVTALTVNAKTLGENIAGRRDLPTT